MDMTQDKSLFDLNDDGVVDLKDLAHALKLAGITVSAAASAVSITAAASAAAGAALVSSTAATIGTGITAAGGAVVGTVAGLSAGTSTAGIISVTNIGSALLVESFTVTTISKGVVTAWAATTTAVAASAEIASGYVAGLPIVKAAAVASLKASGDVVMIGGIAFSVNVAIVTGLVTAIIVGAVVLYLLTSEGQAKLENGELTA
jgi:hypothetical protein